MRGTDNSLPGTFPIVSTVGFDGEGQLRRFRRLSVADVLARYISQVVGRPVTLLDLPVADGADRAARERLVPAAVDALDRLPQARLVVSGDRMTLDSDDLLGLVLGAGKEPGWPEAVLSAQRVAIGGSRGALVRFVGGRSP